MQLSDSRDIRAEPAIVWQAILDPQVLKACIPGCQSMVGSVADGYEAVVKQKVGPVSATFTGLVHLTDIVAPRSIRISGEGKGGVAGFAKGQAAVTLSEPAPGETLLAYQVTSSVGGKLAQLGSRLIEGAAKGYADTFFTRLKAEIEEPEAVSTETPAAETLPAVAAVPAPTGLSPLIWGGGLVLAVLVFLVWQWG